MIYLTYAEIPSKTAKADEVAKLFGDVAYLGSLIERKNDASRQESLAALLLLAETLGNMGVKVSEIGLTKDENGRPTFGGETGLDLSLSHSGGLVACAVSTEGRVGVDIEKISEDSKYERIAKRFLSEAERGTVNNARDFARVWTRKEAYYKFIGKGALAATDSEGSEDVNIESFAVEGEYFISVCFEKSVNICKNPQKTEIK